MKKWILAACAYLFVLIGGYMVYGSLTENKNPEEKIPSHHEPAVLKGEENHAHEKNHSEHNASQTAESEVSASVSVQGQEIMIALEDLSGRPVTDLEINHEKVMHLIVVDTHLDKYVHLHPELEKPGLFKVAHELGEGSYKAFIDIKPKKLSYTVAPIFFSIGQMKETHAHDSVKADKDLVKTIDGRKAELKLSSFTAGKAVKLTFLVEGELQPYLGAVGHVVILDEKAEKYVHVHPANEIKPVFETTFDESGIYKIWAEFKQEGKVRVYPFTVEITP